jgi:hypothetical protein
MKNYDLYRGPYPHHLRTWGDVLNEAYWENWLHDHVKVGPKTFIGKMPVRQDVEIELPTIQWDKNLDLSGWDHAGFTIHWIRSTWWGRLKHRFKIFFKLYPPSSGDGPQLI